MRGKLVLAALAVTAAGLVTGSAKAAPLYDNIYTALPFYGSDGTEGVNANTGGGPLFDSFSTLAAYNFAHLDLVLDVSGAGVGSISVDLYSDNGGIPGGLLQNLGTVNGSSLSTSRTVVGLGSFTPISLAVSTRYWIGLTEGNLTNIEWSFSGNMSGPGVSGELWADNLGVAPNSPNSGPFQMRVSDINPAATPLPAALPLFAGGLGALGVIGWVRKRKRTPAV